MNVSKLTLAQQCKAFSDAAEYNRLKAKTLAMATNPKLSVIRTHLCDADLFAAECRRLQSSLNYQRQK